MVFDWLVMTNNKINVLKERLRKVGAVTCIRNNKMKLLSARTRPPSQSLQQFVHLNISLKQLEGTFLSVMCKVQDGGLMLQQTLR